jgi:uncharacterized protein YbjT (DUF2867 family)
MRVMVVGATGVVGRRAVPLMIRHGHRVTAIGRSPERLDNLARHHCPFVGRRHDLEG